MGEENYPHDEHPNSLTMDPPYEIGEICFSTSYSIY